VSLAFWLSRKMHHHDVAAHVAAQCVGACLGATLLRLAWPDFATVGYGVTRPGPSVTAVEAVVIEAGMSALLVLTILIFVSSMRTARWTPLAVWVVVTLLVWQGAPYTGASLNPARSLGAALVALDLHDLWIYLLGPPQARCWQPCLSWPRCVSHPPPPSCFTTLRTRASSCTTRLPGRELRDDPVAAAEEFVELIRRRQAPLQPPEQVLAAASHELTGRSSKRGAQRRREQGSDRRLVLAAEDVRLREGRVIREFNGGWRVAKPEQVCVRGYQSEVRQRPAIEPAGDLMPPRVAATYFEQRHDAGVLSLDALTARLVFVATGKTEGGIPSLPLCIAEAKYRDDGDDHQ
jgi:hypothetical protein